MGRGARTLVIRSDDSDESETQGGRSHASYMDESHASSVGESSQIQEEVDVQDSQDSQRSQRFENRAQKSKGINEALKQAQVDLKIKKKTTRGQVPKSPSKN